MTMASRNRAERVAEIVERALELPVEQRLRKARHRQCRHRAKHHRLGPPDVDAWNRWIDKHKRVDPVRVGRGFEDRDVSPHRVAHEAHRARDDLLDEVMDESRVGADRGRASEQRGLSETGEIDGERVVRPRDLWCDGHPVQGVAGQAVNHEQGWARAAEVYVVNGPMDVCDLMPQCVMNPTPGIQRPGA